MKDTRTLMLASCLLCLVACDGSHPAGPEATATFARPVAATSTPAAMVTSPSPTPLPTATAGSHATATVPMAVVGTSTPTVIAAPSPTALPTATNGVITYCLVAAPDPFVAEGSRLFYSVTPTQPPSVFSLGGQFDVIPVLPAPPNVTVALRITRAQLTAFPFLVQGDGDVGLISITASDSAQQLSAEVELTFTHQPTGEITGPVPLTGTGSTDTFTADFPPAFRPLTVSSTGDLFSNFFRLEIVAAPAANGAPCP